jgi:hypothetical protein
MSKELPISLPRIPSSRGLSMLPRRRQMPKVLLLSFMKLHQRKTNVMLIVVWSVQLSVPARIGTSCQVMNLAQGQQQHPMSLSCHSAQS